MTLISNGGKRDFSLLWKSIRAIPWSRSGQSTIEFLISFIFAFGILLLAIKIALNLTNGYLAHYATFMASRTYLVVDSNSAEVDGADEYAFLLSQRVFNKFRIGGFIPDARQRLRARPPGVGGNPVYTGIIFKFTQEFSFSDMTGGKVPMDFVSESFLGREPTRATCLQRICDSMKMIGKGCGSNITYYDNGC